MRNSQLPGKIRPRKHAASMLRNLSCVLALLVPVLAGPAQAQGSLPDGEYAAVFKGKIYYTDRQPAEQQIVEQATIRVSSAGGNVTIDVGQIGSAMSATRFTGTSGNDTFVAMHSVPGRENQAKLIWGAVQNQNTLRGTLLYPRVADGLVPGFTELAFEARGNASAAAPTPRERMPAATSSSGSSSSSGLNSRLPRTTLPSVGTGTTSTKPKKELKPRQPAATAGSSIIRGTISGDTRVVRNVQLVDENENTLQTTSLDRNGRYQFNNVGAGLYYIYVNDGTSESWITTPGGDRSVDADGRSSYTVNFKIRER